MLCGRLSPELGGAPEFVDVVGLNYYPYNQWFHHDQHGEREVLPPEHPDHRPLRELLAEVAARYGRPLLIAETGTENEARPEWFRMVARETLAARAAGVPVEGVCLYPVVNHPGWDDDRHCHNGLWDYPDAAGERPVYAPLAEALTEAQAWERGEPDPAAAQGTGAETGAEDGSPQAARLDGARLAEVLARWQAVAPVVEAEAARRGAQDAFPHEALAALAGAGLLEAGPAGPLGLSGPDLLRLLRRVGQASLVLGRLYEGHLNALRLVTLHGSAAQQAQAAQDAAAGHLFGVWNTEDADALHLTDDGALRGSKTFASGGPFVTRPLVTAERPGHGRVMLLLDHPGAARYDPDPWQPLGMHGTLSGRMTLDGLAVSGTAQLGPGGAYYLQPEFGGGALRFLAVQLGGADALLSASREVLRGLGRGSDPAQQLRFAGVAAGLEGAWQVVLEASRRLERFRTSDDAQLDELLAYVALARTLTEDACLACAEATERAVGARGLLAPAPAERLLRDLRMYLRQPAPDAARLQLGAFVLGGQPGRPVWSDEV